MIRFLKAAAFGLAVILAAAAARPFSAADTFAAEPAVHRVTLIEGRDSTIHYTTARTVGAFLEEAGADIGPYDNVTPHYRRRMENRLTIQVDRAFYIDLAIDGETTQRLVSPGTTKGSVLNTIQRETDTALMFEGNTNEVITQNQTMSFYTWRSEYETNVEFIEYVTEYESTPSLSAGIEMVRQEGVPGERHIEYMVVFIGNQEYTREVVDEVVIEPISQIIDRGVGGDLGTLTDTSCPSFRYLRRLTMNATAYTAGLCCTGKGPGHPLYGITASGRRVEHGIVAVDPSVIPLGTRLYVEGYGFALAADTGSAIRGYKIDLFMYNLNDARRFGRRDITVFVLE